jgi:penicillin amidase
MIRVFCFVFLIFTSMRASALSCRIWEDRQAIPHLKVADTREFYTCLGYVHGSRQGFHVDYARKSAQGRLAEFFGFQFLRDDIQMRAFGLEAWAERILRDMKPQEREVLAWYSQGLSKGLDDSRAYEFEEFGYRPEAWTERNTVEVILLQLTVPLSFVLPEKLRQGRRFSVFNEQIFRLQSEKTTPWYTPTVDQPPKTAAALPERDAVAFSELSALPAPAGFGSNAFVLSPKKTREHAALLSSDPHLGFSYPLPRYMVHLEMRNGSFVFAGSVPGSPILPMGVTSELSWGVTYPFIENVPMFVIDEAKKNQLLGPWETYWFKLGFLKLPWFTRSRALPGHWVAFRETQSKSGPITPILQWPPTGLEISDFATLVSLPFQPDAPSFLAQLKQTSLPHANYLVADRRGNIGYALNGKKFLKPSYDLKIGRQGGLQNFEPQWLSADELPLSSLNPSENFIVSANNISFPDAEKYLGSTYIMGFRAHRMRELLQEKSELSMDEAMKVTCDTQATDAKILMPEMLPVVEAAARARPARVSEAFYQEALGLLKSWNYQTGVDCRACLIHRLWINFLLSESPYNEALLYNALKDPAWSAHAKEALTTAFFQALDRIENVYKGEFPPWGAAHFARVAHEAGAGFRHTRTRPLPGDHFALFATTVFSHRLDPRFAVEMAPTLRMVAQMREDGARVFLTLPFPNDDRDFFSSSENFPSDDWIQCRYTEVDLKVKWDEVAAKTVDIQSN